MTDRLRLHKLLARAGVASRRRCEELIAGGRVQVNDHTVTAMGVTVDPETDVVRVDGTRVPPPSPHAYLALNKPYGVHSTMRDPQGRRCLADLLADVLPDRGDRLFHVGRLDADTSGLLLLTNDGDLAHRMTHPSYEVAKTYLADVRGPVGTGAVRSLRAGVRLEDGTAAADRVTIVDRQGGNSLLEIEVHIGRNRVVRRMLDAVGHPVVRLTRTGFGAVRLGRLPQGQIRDLTRDELGTLLDSVSP